MFYVGTCINNGNRGGETFQAKEAGHEKAQKRKKTKEFVKVCWGIRGGSESKKFVFVVFC